jgi:hypothetical protein
MYAEPLRDLSFLVGGEVTQLCVDPFHVILNLHGETSILVAGRFLVDDRETGELPDAARHLFPLLGSKIVDAKMIVGGHGVLKFSNGLTLCMENTFANYESYTITAPGHHVIV